MTEADNSKETEAPLVDAKPSREPGFIIGWFNSALNATKWFGRRNVMPRDAATLLCGFNPKHEHLDPGKEASDETTPLDFRYLIDCFEHVAEESQNRTLENWLAIAQKSQLKYHSWIDRYLEARAAAMNRSATANEAASNQGVIKQLILASEWPIPPDAPSLDSILDKAPKWVSPACTKVGRRGKGHGGSHLWNPAMLAVCLATRTRHKQWVCKPEALTRLIRCDFPA